MTTLAPREMSTSPHTRLGDATEVANNSLFDHEGSVVNAKLKTDRASSHPRVHDARSTAGALAGTPTHSVARVVSASATETASSSHQISKKARALLSEIIDRGGEISLAATKLLRICR